MNLNKKPVTGMRDIMPKEMEIRNYVQDVIKKTYSSYGFNQIETPCVESIENLTSRQGGENEKLIFKILKRGEKLNLDNSSNANDLVDNGLRYDLTVPLVRYYSKNANELPVPFKALQMGNVWRADRPQRGRYRQFMQCDIDILGEAENLAEIELILATTDVLKNLGFSDFEIRINDRRILKSMAKYSGFLEEELDEVFIILDKFDKIGIDGVRGELVAHGFKNDCVDTYIGLFDGIRQSDKPLSLLKERMKDALDDTLSEWIDEIICGASRTGYKIVFDPSLVRGMSYYTGTIFEISMPQLGISCGGGGRYDKMVGNFTGQNVPACGFSIGFERIILILTQQEFKMPKAPEMKAYLVEKGISGKRLREILKNAEVERKAGVQVLVSRMKKNKKFQKEQLLSQGYNEFVEFYKDPLKN